MAQHDFVINNQGFPAFRSDLNAFLQAVGTTHSGTSLPSGAVAGLIWLDTTNAGVPILKYYDGTDNITLATITHATNTVVFAGASADLVNDTTPQLGGDLDVQTNKLVSTSNLNVKVYPNGTGVFEVGGSTNSGRIQLNCEQNSHGIKLASPPHSAAQSYTLTFPSTAPVAGKILQTDGSGNLSFASVSGGIEWQSVHTSATLTAVANYGYFLNTTSNAITVTLPASPSAGNQIALVDYAGTFDTNALTINPNGNKIEGATDNLQLTGEREGVLLVYIDSTQGWLATSGINEGTDALSPAPYAIDFLVIAGGGSGGSADQGAGGGAGGFRTSTQTVTTGTVITVTVGDGASAPGALSGGTRGSNSSISGSGLTTITSTGGGGGGEGNNNPFAGQTGGSGGGSSRSNTAGGLGNTPSTSPSQGNNGGSGAEGAPAYASGGGGGAGANGVNGTTSVAGNGGNGTASSITGSSETRAGGGGGSGNNVGSSGGNGGGGAGNAGANGTAGTANTGGGGGGAATSSPTYFGGAGGKGVVILSIPTANYSGTITGSPTESTSGSNKILVYNGSGSYTT